jgi:hypothetical protein
MGEHRLKILENRVLRRIFGPKRDGVTGGGENYTTRSFVICTLRQVELTNSVELITAREATSFAATR